MTLNGAAYCVLENCPHPQDHRSKHGLCNDHRKLYRIPRAIGAENERRIYERSGVLARPNRAG